MTDEVRTNWMNVWLGALLAGVVTLAVFAGTNMAAVPTWLGAVILLFVLIMAVWFAFLRGERELALGAISGYAVLSLISGGQCTLLTVESSTGIGAAQGLFLYPLLLLAGRIAIGVAGSVRKRRERKDGSQ